YYLTRRAWVKDENFKPNTGLLYKVRYTGDRTPPSIRVDVPDQAVPAGGAAVFRVTAAGSGPLTYPWQRDGVDIPGARAPGFTPKPVNPADAGARFRCVVTNAFGTVTTRAATLTVKGPPDGAGLSVNPLPGTYTGPLTVRLSSPPGTEVRYTTDGSDPTARSP